MEKLKKRMKIREELNSDLQNNIGILVKILKREGVEEVVAGIMVDVWPEFSQKIIKKEKKRKEP